MTVRNVLKNLILTVVFAGTAGCLGGGGGGSSDLGTNLIGGGVQFDFADGGNAGGQQLAQAGGGGGAGDDAAVVHNPEPGTLALMGLGLAGTAIGRRRRKSSKRRNS